MRKIEFRAWTGSVMISPKTLFFLIESFEKGNGWAFANMRSKDFVIMQFTGLRDKNGKSIFEGDIVEYINQLGGNRRVFYIIWHEKSASFVTDNLCQIAKSDQYRVIGNIYENSDLLK